MVESTEQTIDGQVGADAGWMSGEDVARAAQLLGENTVGEWTGNGRNDASMASGGSGEGVLALSSTGKIRDERGRLLPGAVLNHHGGRPAKDKALLIALNDRYPPEQIISMVDEAWMVASRPGKESWRGMMEVARFLTEYIIGKPVARTVSVTSKAEDMIARLERMQLGDGEAEG